MRNDVDCPRARSWMTPCVARDGQPATADDGVCVGCGEHPADLLTELVGRYVDNKRSPYSPAAKTEGARRMMLFYCHRCKALPGEWCKTTGGHKAGLNHSDRFRQATEAGLFPLTEEEAAR